MTIPQAANPELQSHHRLPCPQKAMDISSLQHAEPTISTVELKAEQTISTVELKAEPLLSSPLQYHHSLVNYYQCVYIAFPLCRAPLFIAYITSHYFFTNALVFNIYE